MIDSPRRKYSTSIISIVRLFFFLLRKTVNRARNDFAFNRTFVHAVHQPLQKADIEFGRRKGELFYNLLKVMFRL